MTLPSVEENIAAIKTLPEALNVIEQLMNMNHQLIHRIEALEKEVAQLKGQPRKPHFSTQESPVQYSSPSQPKGNHHKSEKQISIDRKETLPEVKQCECGSETFRILRTWEKIVQGIIIRRDNVCYEGRDKACTACGKLFRSILPAETEGNQFSPELGSWVSMWKYDCRMSEEIIYRLLTGIGIHISVGQMSEMIGRNSKALEKSYTHLKVWGVKLSAYFHTDATGHIRQVFGKESKIVSEHIQIMCHKFLSLFRITSHYNAEAVGSEVVGKRGSKNICISDDGSPNGRLLQIIRKQLCWIHELRHYRKLTAVVRKHQQEVELILHQFWEWYAQAKEYGINPTQEKRRKLEERFDQIVATPIEYQELKERLLLTKKKKDRLLLFLDYPGIPIENNQAERDLRFAVILRKLTGGTRSLWGNKSLERHLSILQTIRKQGLPVFETFHGLIMGTVDPFVLTQKTLPAVNYFPR